MVGTLTAIAIDSHIRNTFDHLGTAKKAARVVTTSVRLDPDITARLNSARNSNGNRCDVSRDARTEQRGSCAIISRKLFQNNSVCNLGWNTILTIYGDISGHLHDICCKPKLA